MKRIALAAALLGGCVIDDHVAKHPIVYDVIDGVVIVGATSTAIIDHHDVVQGAVIGVDVLALAVIPFLVLDTILINWRAN